MRHRKIRSKLNRTSEHRLALMRNLTSALVQQEKIRTTEVKAKQLRAFAEPLVTLAKAGDLHSRRRAFSRLGRKEIVHKLFEEIGPRVGDRPGGYLRVVKDGPRHGDGAMMAYVEFVDQVDQPPDDKAKTPKTMKQRIHERRKELARRRR